jgi:hypothetical protein
VVLPLLLVVPPLVVPLPPANELLPPPPQALSASAANAIGIPYFRIVFT